MNKIWHDVSEKPKDAINVAVVTKDGQFRICKLDKPMWMWADGFPVGTNANGDTMYSSWCELDEEDIDKWAYINDLIKNRKS